MGDQDDGFEHEKTRLGIGSVAGVPDEVPPTVEPLPEPPVAFRPSMPFLDTRPDNRVEPERYTLKQKLGQGGMGEVLLARDEQIGREVAVKRIRSHAPTSEQLARFVREARVQGGLEHPAVVPVYDLALDRDGRPFFVMKRLTGTDMQVLLSRMRSGEEPDEAGARRRLLRAFTEVCLAIEFAHQRGVIHRDLKPANITLGDFGEVYVLDWGVARAGAADDRWAGRPPTAPAFDLEDAATRAGTVFGTPQYMAPEQMVGETVGPAADIYALGCMLFEIAAGEPLHPRTRSVGQAASLADARPSTRRPDSPPELDAICLRATAFEPEERFGSARALGAAVQAFLDGDRDLNVRRELAVHHLAEARAAIAGGTDERSRTAAVRAAGRALALDPTATEAADLVSRLMLEPPREVPADVDRRMAEIDNEMARTQGRFASISMLGYFAFVPFLLWTGIRSPIMVIVMMVLSTLGSLQIAMVTKRERIASIDIYTNAMINAVLIAVVCRMVGPFIMAPTLVVMTLMAYAAHPNLGRISIVATILALGVAVPWFLEVVGVFERTYRFEGGGMVLTSPILEFAAAPAQLAFALLLVMSVAVVSYLLRNVVNSQRAATRRLEMQAWHLRQIVPTVR